jgi:hypothetical protein
MPAVLSIVSGLGVFAAFIAQLIALTNPPLNRKAIATRIVTLFVWLGLLVTANVELLDADACQLNCVFGMSRGSMLLELGTDVFNIFVAWFVLRGVPRLVPTK